MEKLREPKDEVEGKIKKFVRSSFDEKVASKDAVKDFYAEAIRISGIVREINRSNKPIKIVDVGGGGGRIGKILDEYVEKGIVKKQFDYIVVDISRAELEKGSSKFRIVGDMMDIPLRDEQMDFVFLLNMPSAAGVMKDYIRKLKPVNQAEAAENREVLKMLEIATGNIDFLNYLEGVRVLKKNGVFVSGLPTHGGLEKSGLEGRLRLIRDMFMERGVKLGEIPLRRVDYEVLWMDWGVVNLWRDYGLDIKQPVFYIESLRRTGDIDAWVKALRENLDFVLNELSKNKRFWEIVKRMEEANQLQEHQA